MKIMDEYKVYTEEEKKQVIMHNEEDIYIFIHCY
jgi:hypothetical protein